MISILILTKNEEKDLSACLQSIEWCDDVHILDSFSDDKTREIANQYGTNFYQRVFDGFATQRNYALNNLNFKYEWIFILDADERINVDLYQIMIEKLKSDTLSANGYRIRRRDYLDGKWLKYSQISPYYIRLVRKNKVQYHREINEVIEVEGNVEVLDGYFDHYPFSKGYSYWLNKHNQYSSMEAMRWVEEHKNSIRFSVKKALFDKDFSVRRYNQKGLFYKLPFRPLVKFLYMFFFRRAFLDGRAGITYAFLQSIYEYFIVLKTRELMK